MARGLSDGGISLSLLTARTRLCLFTFRLGLQPMHLASAGDGFHLPAQQIASRRKCEQDWARAETAPHGSPAKSQSDHENDHGVEENSAWNALVPLALFGHVFASSGDEWLCHAYVQWKRYADDARAFSHERYTVQATLITPARGTRYRKGTYRNIAHCTNGQTCVPAGSGPEMKRGIPPCLGKNVVRLRGAPCSWSRGSGSRRDESGRGSRPASGTPSAPCRPERRQKRWAP